MDKGPTHYDLLQVPETASAEEIRQAYHRLAQPFHPDLFSEDEPWLQALTEAHDILIDGGERKAYDEKHAAERARDEAPQQTEQAQATTPEASYRRNQGKRFIADLGILMLMLMFTAAPFGVMYFVAPAHNAHPTVLLDLISVGCFCWLVVAVRRTFTTFIELF